MFDYSAEGLSVLTGPALADAVVANHVVQVQAENRTLVVAAAWADLHAMDPDQPHSPLVERATVVGSDGTPEIGEFCCVEFGALVGVGMVAGRSLIADALDVRHRLRLLWDRVSAGEVRAWKARKIAEATRQLSWAAAAEVDAAVAGLVETLPWPRFVKILQAAIVDADPALARQREVQAKTRRGVWATTSEDGLKAVIVHATTGDAVVFMATVNRIADILLREDATAGRPVDTVEVRRSRAVGILAQPALALQLLLAHRTDPDPHGPAEPDPEPDPESEPEPEDVVAGGSGLWLPDRCPEWLNPQRLGQGLVQRLAPRVVVHYHLSDAAIREGYGLARPADHGDPLSLQALRDWLAGTGCSVQVRPIFDPAGVAAVDRYEIPARMRAAVAVRDVADAFPYGSLSRRVDLDHSVPYDPNGPPGQTGPHNLAPLSRPPHRVVTFSKWRRRQPDPGTYLFRSPHGRVWIVTNQGTMSLGRTAYSRVVWDAAAPPPEVSAVARSATRAFAGTSVQFERSIWSREHEGPNTVGAERARPAGN